MNKVKVGELVKVCGVFGMHRVVAKTGRTLKVRKEFEDGRRGTLTEVDALEVSYSAGRVASHDDGKLVRALSWNGLRLENRLIARRKEKARMEAIEAASQRA